MKNLNYLSARKVITIGLLLAVLPFLINDFYHLPDFVRGFFTGIGLAMEVMGLIKMRKAKSNTQRDAVKE